MSTPIWREDTKGKLKALLVDFRAQCAGELRDFFILHVEDTNAYDEYAKWLTHDEMVRAFRAVLKKAA